jgi:beta-phosphoglucomutase-like phosphatase (HAD superfamily)
VPEAKPAPDTYLEACRRLGAPPAQSVGLEDSPTGVAAARAAGLYVVGVPSLAGVVLDADLLAGSLAESAVHAALGLVGDAAPLPSG